MKKTIIRVLGIHGRATIIAWQKTLWTQRTDDIRARGHQIYVPQFDESEDPRYETWETELQDLNVENYDCILAVSHWSGVLARYIVENDIHLKRVVFCCPGRWIEKREHTWALYDWLEENNVKLATFVDEVFIVHWVNDEVVPYSEWEKFQKQVGGELYALEGFWHKPWDEAIAFVNDLVINWAQ